MFRIGVPVADGVDAEGVKDKVIECCCVGNPGDNVWEFMRIRYDKDHPNAWKTYEKVNFRADVRVGVRRKWADGDIGMLTDVKFGEFILGW